MRYLIFLLIPLIGNAQSDTIFTKKGPVILGKIGHERGYNLYYTSGSGSNERMSLKKIERYSYFKPGAPSTNASMDSLRLNALINDLEQMKYNLRKHTKKYNTGVLFQLIGLAAMGSGAAYISQNGDRDNIGPYLMLGGGVVSLIGTFTIIGSHQWIGKAGAVNNGVGIKINRH